MKFYEAYKIINEVIIPPKTSPQTELQRRTEATKKAQDMLNKKPILKAPPKAPKKPGILATAANAINKYNPVSKTVATLGAAGAGLNKYAGDPLGTLSKNIKQDATNAKNSVQRKVTNTKRAIGDAKDSVVKNVITDPLNKIGNKFTGKLDKEAERGRTIDAQRAMLDAQVARKQKAKQAAAKPAAQPRPPQQPQPIQPQVPVNYGQPQTQLRPAGPYNPQPVQPRPVQVPTNPAWRNVIGSPNQLQSQVPNQSQYGVQPGQRFKRTM